MCLDPLSMIGAGIGMAGSIMSGQANASAARANAQAADIRGEAAKANAQTALDYAAGRTDQIGLKVAQVQGQTKAYAGAGNIAVNSGSPLALQMFSAQQGNVDKQLTIAQGLNTASGMNFDASTSFMAAGQDRMAASWDQFSGFLGAGTQLLRGFGSMRGYGGGNGGYGGVLAPGIGWGG